MGAKIDESKGGARRSWRLPLFLSLLALLFCAAATPSFASYLGHAGYVKALAISPDGQRVLSGGFDYSAILWDRDTQEPIKRFDAHDGAVNAVAFTPDGTRILTADDAAIIRLWDIESGQELARFTGHEGKIAALTLAPDGEHFATAGWDRTVRSGLWSSPKPCWCWRVMRTTSTPSHSRPTAERW